MTTARLTALFRLDAVFNAALGVILVALMAAPDVLGLPWVDLIFARRC